jgi:hypothetical protein
MGLLDFPPEEWPGLLGSPMGRLPPPGPTAPMFVPSMEAAYREPTFSVAQNSLDPTALPRPGFTPLPPGIFDEWRRHAERGLTGLLDTYFRDTTNSGAGGGDPDGPGCYEEWKDARQLCSDELVKRKPNKRITGGHKSIDDCARGWVSERCGGNPYSRR